MKKLFFPTLFSVAAFAQPFTFGVKVGAPASDALNTVQSGTINFHSYTNRYLIGPTGEIHLPFGLGVEVDALYRHYNFQTVGSLGPSSPNSPLPGAPGSTITTAGKTSAWEFPVLLKYRFPTRIVRPFLDAGIAWDTLQGFKQAITIVSPVPITAPSNYNQPSHSTTTGVVLGGGLDIHVPFVHVSPEIRYTHWTNQHFTASTVTSGIFSASTGYNSNQDQVEAMVGITF